MIHRKLFRGCRTARPAVCLMALAAAGSTLWAQAALPPRIGLRASMRAPLPEGLEIRKIAPAAQGIWFLTLDRRPEHPEAAVYFWSAEGMQRIFPDESGEPAGTVTDLAADPSGTAWLATARSVFRFEEGAFRRQPEWDALQAAAFAGSKDLWVINRKNEVFFLPAWDARAARKTAVPAEGRITRWTATSLGDLRLVVRTAQGDRILEAARGAEAARAIAPLEGRVFPEISLLYSDSLLNLWIGLQGGGLLRCSAAACDSVLPETADRLLEMRETEDGDLYLVPEGDPQREIRLILIPASSRASLPVELRDIFLDQATGSGTTVAFDAGGGIWLGTDRRGALRLQGTENLEWLRGKPSPRAAAASAAATLPALPGAPRPQATGITNFQNAKFAYLFVGRGLTNPQISSITADGAGRLYFTTGYTNLLGANAAGSGVERWDHRQFQLLTTANGLAGNTVQCSLYDPSTNTVWFGTTNGVSRLNAATDTFLSNLLPGVNVRDLERDGAGSIWVGTFGSGVFRLSAATGATVAQYTSANTAGGLVHDNVVSLALEDNGNVLWVGTDRGNPAAGTEHVGGVSRYQINTGTWTPIDLNGVGGVVEYDSNRVLGLAVDASNNLWISSFTKGVYRRSNAGVYTRFQQSNGLGGNSSNVIYAIYRDLGNNLWFGFGGFGDVASPQKAAATFLPASQVDSATPAFANYNAANNGYPSNIINTFFAEDAGTMWFGTLGAGVFRLGGPGDAPGWPQALDGYVYTSSPVLADLEGLGKLNIIVGDQAGRVYAFRPDGTRLWTYDAHNAFNPAMFPAGVGNISIQSSPAVGDVDGDGDPEVVVGVGGFAGAKIGPTLNTLGKGQGALIILSRTGALKRVFYPYDITDVSLPNSIQDGFREAVFATPVLANTDDDPELEIHVGAWDNFFYAVNADGSPIYTVDNDGDGRFDEDFLADFTPYTPQDASDDVPGWAGVDDNGNGETDEGNQYDDDEDALLDEDWPEFPFWAGDSISASAAVADLFGTGGPNLIFGQDYAGTTQYNRGGITRVLDAQGNEAAGWPKANLEQTIQSSPALVDLDGDGTLEIVHGSGLDLSTVGPNPADLLIGQLVYAWKRDGSSFLPTGTGRFASTQGRSFASVAVGDLNKDGKPELVIATTVLTDKNGSPIDAGGNPTAPANALGQLVYAFNSDGSLVPGFPVRPFPFIPNTVLLGSPAIADVNGDGFPDIVVPAGFGLIVLDRNGRVLSGMGVFENLQDPVSAVFQQSSPAIADIDGDGILEAVWASGTSADGGLTGTGGVIRVVKLGPVNAAAYDWPMFRRTAERNAIYGVNVSRPQARVSGGQVIISAQVLRGVNAITSVVADLSPMGGSPAQPLYDTGANGDAVANDGTYSFAIAAAAPGRYYLTVTATDSAGRVARGVVPYVQRGAGKRLITNATGIDFGAVGRGLNQDRHLNLLNAGDTTVTISALTSSNPEFFVAAARSAFSDRGSVSAAAFPQTIPPGGTLNLLLRAKPAATSTGARSSILTITSDDAVQPTRTINLTATAQVLSGGITITDSGGTPTSSLAFPSIPVNTSALNTLMIRSTGPDPLIITNISFDNPAYSVYKPDNPVVPRTFPVNTIPGNQFYGNRYTSSSVLQIRFRPSGVGFQNGTMQLSTNDPVHPVISITLTGGGTGCAVALGRTSFSVPADPSTGTLSITAAAGCAWTAQSNANSWLNFLVSTIGETRDTLALSGSAVLTWQVRRNPSSQARTGTLSINGQTVTFTQAGSSLSANQRYVYLVFNNFLAREPGAEGINFFVPLLNSGALSRTQMAINMFSAPEFNIIERFVVGLYYGILGRDPDYFGWDFHRRNMHLGIVTQDTLVAGFLATPEYAARYGNPSNDLFVTLLYRNALGREPSPSDVAAWAALLNSGTTRTQVAQAFLNSPEFQAGKLNRLNVFLMYATALSRDPGDAGYAAWLPYLNTPGNSVETALYGFVNSPEFLLKLGP